MKPRGDWHDYDFNNNNYLSILVLNKTYNIYTNIKIDIYGL